MAKIAAELEQALAQKERDGAPGGLCARTLAQGDGWTVEDVVCTSGPSDRRFAEQHSCYRIAIVVAGSFECRTPFGRDLMTPGSLLLGNAGHGFECGHDHGSGDRCVSFGYTPAFFEGLAGQGFRHSRLPPAAELAPLVARVCAGLASPAAVPWEELTLQLAARAVPFAASVPSRPDASPHTVARVTRAVRRIDCDSSLPLTLKELAEEAGLSPYHFLRTFESLTGITPHQYLRRARLRNAAIRCAAGRDRILDIALDCGFGDLTNFNRAFRAEFGMSPRTYRTAMMR